MSSGEWTDGAFPVLDPKGFYSTSGAYSVSPFTTTVSGEGSARRQRTHRASAGPATVAAFLAHEADRGSRAATVTRGCAAIRRAIGSPTWSPRPTDREPPTNSEHVRAALRGIRRTVGAARPAKPVLAEAAPRHGPFGVSRETRGETLAD
jgi:hypothetical protein